jgi:acyl-CoA thioester hydrolase
MMASLPASDTPAKNPPFAWPVRVYWEDTDAAGIVYHSNYLNFMERARSEWLRGIGVEQHDLQSRDAAILVVVDIEAHYHRPARYGDLLHVTNYVSNCGRASLLCEQLIYRDSVGGELLATGRARIACLDMHTFKPRPLPKWVLKEIFK